MKTSSAELKRTARENLSGKYGVAMLAMITVSLIPSALLYPFADNASHGGASQKTIYYLASIIITVLQLILTCGQLRLHLNIATRQPYQFSDIFFSFRAHPQKIVGAYLLFVLYMLPAVLPGSVLLTFALLLFTDSAPFIGLTVIVLGAGIIFDIRIALQCSLVFFMLVDNPYASIRGTFRRSKELMEGNKLRLLYLQLSFLGFYLLAVLSCGIGLLWLMPYMQQTMVSFYLDVQDVKGAAHS